GVANRRLWSAPFDSNDRRYSRSLARYLARRGTNRGKTDGKTAFVPLLCTFAVLLGLNHGHHWHNRRIRGLGPGTRRAGRWRLRSRLSVRLQPAHHDARHDRPCQSVLEPAAREQQGSARASTLPDRQDRRADRPRPRDRSDTVATAGSKGPCPAGHLRSRLAKDNGEIRERSVDRLCRMGRSAENDHANGAIGSGGHSLPQYGRLSEFSFEQDDRISGGRRCLDHRPGWQGEAAHQRQRLWLPLL